MSATCGRDISCFYPFTLLHSGFYLHTYTIQFSYIHFPEQLQHFFLCFVILPFSCFYCSIFHLCLLDWLPCFIYTLSILYRQLTVILILYMSFCFWQCNTGLVPFCIVVIHVKTIKRIIVNIQDLCFSYTDEAIKFQLRKKLYVRNRSIQQ